MRKKKRERQAAEKVARRMLGRVKIIRKDNFDRDCRCEELVAEGVEPLWAQRVCDLMNSDASEDYYVVVPDSYILKQYTL